MIEIFKDEAGGWRYRIKGRNGEILVTSEAYTREPDANRGVDDLYKLLCGQAPMERRRVDG